MRTEPVFDMPPPNEDFNTESWDGWLNNVETTITVDGHSSALVTHTIPINIGALSNQDLPIHDLWDAVVFTLLIRKDRKLSSILTDLQRTSWSLLYRSKLRAHLLKLFNEQYHQHIYNRDLELAGEFFTNHPGYQGIFVAFDGQVITSEIVSSGKLLLPPLTEYVGLEKLKAGKKLFEQHIQVISQWCMCNFSYHREKWCYPQELQPVKLETLTVEQEQEFVGTPIVDSKLTKEHKPTKQDRLQEKLNAMTPEQRRDYFIMKKLERKAAALKNKFGRDLEVEDILEC